MTTPIRIGLLRLVDSARSWSPNSVACFPNSAWT